jgi:putative ABC transport system substrate-binding protein
MNRRRFFAALASVSWLSHATRGAAQDKIPRIGFLTRTPPTLSVEQYLREAMRELGYVEGKSILFESRRGRLGAGVEQVRPLADELVQMNVDLIVTFSTPAARAAVEATKTIPVVFTAAGDPIATGLVKSLARPGTNATGVSIIASELVPKRLDLLHQVAPHARRVVFLVNPVNPSSAYQMEPVAEAARTFGMKLETLTVRNADEIKHALRSASWKSAQAALIGGDSVMLALAADLAKAVRMARLPAIFPWREYHEHGVLMSYSANVREIMRRGAYYVDRILKGARPSELPVEQVSKLDLIIDLRVAREMGIKVPQELLYRADEVIR